jgi:hypothetical protein
VISRANAQYWDCFNALPDDIQRVAKEKYRLWEKDCFHPSLHFKPLMDDVWSVRINQNYSRSLSQRFTMPFSPHTLGNLLHRTRLKLAASMLNFQEWADFADYFGSRWHYYLGAIIASIPVPLVFGKGQFESGVAAKVLREFAQDPFPYLDEAGKKKMMAAHSDLLRKFTELAFDESAESRWQESQPAEADNIDVGPATEADLQGALMEASGNPF